MTRKKIGVLLLMALLVSFGANAQRATFMRINEVMVINENDIQDDYGQHDGWIELYNSSAAPVNIAGCWLTTDRNNPKMYAIPKGDNHTIIPLHQTALFFCEGHANRGTFYTNFKLDSLKENYIALYDGDGKNLIDSITIPAGQVADVTFGRLVDGKTPWGVLKVPTPNSNNVTNDKNEKVENFKQRDGYGIAMTITSMATVFLGLALLYLCFKATGKASIKASKRRAAAAGVKTSENTGHESGEIFAAIATALYELSDDAHDNEPTILTINKVQRNYSPWSSKIYTLRQTPRN